MLRQRVCRPSHWRVVQLQKAALSTVSIGGISVPKAIASEPHLVPTGFVPSQLSQESLGHLRWMLQKDLLEQDMFLIGPPGPARRHLALQFAELLHREVEYVAISQDTTESDLKQRREIACGAAVFTDQAPVRAAIHGRLLILDGLEKAERNVLPTLNNLLENREMALEDGRFLMKAESFDALLAAGHSADALAAQNLVRVHPRFRVLALGLPVPPFPGRSLDPPLRSRFQARRVAPPAPGALLETLLAAIPGASVATAEQLVGLAEALHVVENTTTGGRGTRPPHLSPGVLEHVLAVATAFPSATDAASVLLRVFPVGLWPEHRDTLERVVTACLPSNVAGPTTYTLTATAPFTATLSIGSDAPVPVACGVLGPNMAPLTGYLETPSYAATVARMLQDHALGKDLCLLGPKGSGKSGLARQFAHRLGYPTELCTLFKDMTSRDLFQRRATDADGNTYWEDSPLMHAARHGHIAILDGVHRLHGDTLATLQRLLQDREIDLADGAKFIAAHKATGVGAVPIHAAFRVVCLGEAGGAKGPTWLSSESVAMLAFHEAPSLAAAELTTLLTDLNPSLPSAVVSVLVAFWAQVQATPELSLSLRQLLRVARRLDAFPDQALADLAPVVHDTMMTQFVGPAQAAAIRRALGAVHSSPPANTASSAVDIDTAVAIVAAPDSLTIGNVTYPITRPPARPELVPQPLYYDIPKHTRVMQQVLQDIVAGQRHLLLIGNQGVGKNKVVDRLLQLMQQEREYIQLHRDTTVQTLTLVPTLEGGRIRWEDSPLVRAVKEGRTLVVDEADKAPLEVVCVLKGLIEDGEMLLGDGRRILDPAKVAVADADPTKTILVHPAFRMWVLANRPGYPFLGNNLFSEIGDIFASHSIDNPDAASELALLQAYAPSVPTPVLRRLCGAFAELRQLVEDGAISYPYSTREAVAVAKHLEMFPDDGVTATLENVLAFDAYDAPLRQLLADVFHRYVDRGWLDVTCASHGIPLAAADRPRRLSIDVAETVPLPPRIRSDVWTPLESETPLPVASAPLKPRRLYLEPPTTRTFGVQHHRLESFSELVASWAVPLAKRQVATSMAVLPSGAVHVVTAQPLGLHSFIGLDGDRKHLFTELEDSYGYSMHTTPTLHAFGDDLLLHVPSAELLLHLSETHQVLQAYALPSLSPKKKARSVFNWTADRAEPMAVVDAAANRVLLYQALHPNFHIIDVREAKCWTVQTSAPVVSAAMTGDGTFRLHYANDAGVYVVDTSDPRQPMQSRFTTADTAATYARSVAPTATMATPVRHLTHPEAYVQLLAPTATDSFDVWSVPRSTAVDRLSAAHFQSPRLLAGVPTALSVVDVAAETVAEVALPAADDVVAIGSLANGDALTLQAGGQLCRWQLDTDALAHDLASWKLMFAHDALAGTATPLALQMPGGESTPKTGLDTPKVGKDDPDNQPHVGGNTWAGGTGGSDTAGLGGRGGPYRLDKGHKVHQVSQAKKDEVTDDARRKAKAMADAALADKLKAIDMTGGEWQAYQKYFGRIEQETAQLRSVLDNLEAREKERGWLRHQASGEWDDAKLVDGIAGDRNVFKRRGVDAAPGLQTAPLKKRMLFVVDVSGSILWILDPTHGRLERMLETTMMVMEAFAGFETKVEYAIMGHSGDAPAIPFVPFDAPPADRKQRLQVLRLVRGVLRVTIPAQVLQKMLAHSQYCSSGDHTVAAIEAAVQRVAAKDGDEYFVFVVSDANLDRYGIHPKVLGRALAADGRVNAHAIFVASFADEAARILRHLPPGHGHVCLDTAELPRVFKKIFAASLQP
ncbi:hypothetical protein ACHHYP_14843 [Achlya hypogyna]|uniref:VWFA domain-containing protein n=1 Tax=Achlya hypogyna TaxID=1202772 RepID=A0A1V9YC65_ACHHY|nr:hypothetical protein ACHHYP_14843 [Achlya hypogyna]